MSRLLWSKHTHPFSKRIMLYLEHNFHLSRSMFWKGLFYLDMFWPLLVAFLSRVTWCYCGVSCQLFSQGLTDSRGWLRLFRHLAEDGIPCVGQGIESCSLLMVLGACFLISVVSLFQQWYIILVEWPYLSKCSLRDLYFILVFPVLFWKQWSVQFDVDLLPVSAPLLWSP